jgi:hypothetical protein
MAEPEDSPLPEDPPLTIAEDEVERLLSQAETLAGEIADSAGVDPPLPDGTSAEPDATSAAKDEPDPLAAAEQIEQTLSELNDLVAEANQPDTEPAGEGAANEAGASLPLEGGEATQPETVRAVAGEAEDREKASEFDFDPSVEGDISVSFGEGGSARDAGELPDDGTEFPAGQGSLKRPLKERLLAAGMSIPRAAKSAAATIPSAFLLLLENLDRPFAGVSPATKQLIGYIAIVTLLMGIASLVLPGLLEHNPYEKLGR